MIYLLRLTCCLLVIVLMGCATHHPKIVKTNGLSQCQSICVQRLQYCKQNCTNGCPTCSASATITADVNYCKYVHEIKVQGGYIARGLKSYRDPLQCRKVSCNCSADFSTCNQGCTGIIQKQLRSVPHCP